MRPDEGLNDEDVLAGEAERPESWETGLVVKSVVIGTVALFVLGWIVDRFILS